MNLGFGLLELFISGVLFCSGGLLLSLVVVVIYTAVRDRVNL